MTFTARQYAQALGRTRQWAQHTLSPFPQSAPIRIEGNQASTWEFCALPIALQSELEAAAQRQGFSNACALLAARPSAEQSAAGASQARLEKARKLCAVLLPFFMVKDTESRTQAEFEQALVAAHQREFGCPLSGRQLRFLFSRALRRAAGVNDFSRLELYLDDRESSPGQPDAARPAFDHADLEACLIFKDQAKPTLTERQNAFELSFRHFEELAAESPARRVEIKLSILRFLWSRAPGMAESEPSLQRNWRRKFDRWAASGKKPSGIQDRRKESGFWRAPKIPDQARDAVTAYAVLECGGRLATAWRDYRLGQIPGVTPDPAIVDYYEADPADKSHTPRHVAETVKCDINAMKILHHGERQYQETAHLLLDDSSADAGDWWSSDDCTPPVYMWLASDAGPVLTRGQLLLTVDNRSRRILGFCLIPERNYDSLRILSHFVNVADEHGLPRRGVIWERGIWEKSKILTGSADADSVPPEESELGLRELGVEFKHRHSAKGKVVERVLGLLQDLMEGEPGYCGRNEMVERFDRFKKLKADVDARRVDPSGLLYSFPQWVERLAEICAKYNRTPSGRDTKLDGLSPDQAYQTMQNPANPPVKFDPSSRHLLSTHRRAVNVTANGIKFTCGRRDFLYRNEKTGNLIGRKVLIWFDPESPDVAYVTDLKRQNPFAVEIVNPIPTVGATREQLAEEMGKLRAHQKPILAKYRALKATFKQTFRQNLVSPEMVDRSRAFAEGAEEIRSHRAAQDKTVSRARRAGVSLDHTPRNPGRVDRGLELEKAARARIAAEENQNLP